MSISTFSDVFERVRTISDAFGRVRMQSDAFRCIGTRSDNSGKVRNFLEIWGSFWTIWAQGVYFSGGFTCKGCTIRDIFTFIKVNMYGTGVYFFRGVLLGARIK